MIPLTETKKRVCRNPVKAIRQKCLDCSNWSYTEVENCNMTECSLYPFRFGKNPFRTRKPCTLTDEQRKEIGERLKTSKKTEHTDEDYELYYSAVVERKDFEKTEG